MLTPSGQTASMKINYIIIHDTEGSYDGTIRSTPALRWMYDLSSLSRLGGAA